VPTQLALQRTHRGTKKGVTIEVVPSTSRLVQAPLFEVSNTPFLGEKQFRHYCTCNRDYMVHRQERNTLTTQGLRCLRHERSRRNSPGFAVSAALRTKSLIPTWGEVRFRFPRDLPPSSPPLAPGNMHCASRCLACPFNSFSLLCGTAPSSSSRAAECPSVQHMGNNIIVSRWEGTKALSTRMHELGYI